MRKLYKLKFSFTYYTENNDPEAKNNDHYLFCYNVCVCEVLHIMSCSLRKKPKAQIIMNTFSGMWSDINKENVAEPVRVFNRHPLKSRFPNVISPSSTAIKLLIWTEAGKYTHLSTLNRAAKINMIVWARGFLTDLIKGLKCRSALDQG